MDVIELFKQAAVAMQSDMRYLALDAARRAGYARVRIDGNLYDLDEEIALEKNKKHTVEIVVDRLVMREGIRGRLSDSLETALQLTGALVTVDVIGGEAMEFSQSYACPEHDIAVEELTPRMFSFNNPFGACPTCTGLGTFMKVDPELIVPDKTRSIRESAIKASGWYYAEGSMSEMYYQALADKYGFTLDTPFEQIPQAGQNAVLYGTNGETLELHRENAFGSGNYKAPFEGIIPNLERRFRESSSQWMKEEISRGEYRRFLRKEHPRGTGLYQGNAAYRAGTPHWRRYFEGDQKPLGIFEKCGVGLPDSFPRGQHAFGRRKPAHSLGHTDRQRVDRRTVCAGRAQHRFAPARQRQADCDAEKAA